MEKKKNMFQVAGNFVSQLKYVLFFDDDGKYFWNIALYSIICILNLKMAKKKKTIQVAGTCQHRKMKLHCINKRLKMQLFREAGYIDHT